MSSGILSLSCALLLSLATLFLLCFGFATDYWVLHTVDRDKIKEETKDITGYSTLLSNDANYFSRNSGLFRTCYKGSETVELDVNKDNCITEKGYEWTSREETLNWDDTYHQRKHLMRSHLIIMAMAVLISILGCMFGSFGCIKERETYVTYAAAFMFLTAFFIVACMACFHVYRDMERNDIDEEPFEESWSRDPYLKENTKVDFGYSYFVTWISCGTAILAGIMFFVTKMKWANNLRQERRKMNSKKGNTGFNPNMKQPQPFYVPQSGGGYQQQPVEVQPPPQQKVTIIHHYPNAGQTPYTGQQYQAASEPAQHYSFENPDFQHTTPLYPRRKSYDNEYAFMDIQ